MFLFKSLLIAIIIIQVNCSIIKDIYYNLFSELKQKNYLECGIKYTKETKKIYKNNTELKLCEEKKKNTMRECLNCVDTFKKKENIDLNNCYEINNICQKDLTIDQCWNRCINPCYCSRMGVCVTTGSYENDHYPC